MNNSLGNLELLSVTVQCSFSKPVCCGIQVRSKSAADRKYVNTNLVKYYLYMYIFYNIIIEKVSLNFYILSLREAEGF